VSNEVQRVASGLDGVNSVSSLAGFSLLSEGTGAVYGMHLISLKTGVKEPLLTRKSLVCLMLKEKT
jgi:HAE1 family hydrophobic/amphiphilic exporter-1